EPHRRRALDVQRPPTDEWNPLVRGRDRHLDGIADLAGRAVGPREEGHADLRGRGDRPGPVPQLGRLGLLLDPALQVAPRLRAVADHGREACALVREVRDVDVVVQRQAELDERPDQQADERDDEAELDGCLARFAPCAPTQRRGRRDRSRSPRLRVWASTGRGVLTCGVHRFSSPRDCTGPYGTSRLSLPATRPRKFVIAAPMRLSVSTRPSASVALSYRLCISYLPR